jgi:plastocyanin
MFAFLAFLALCTAVAAQSSTSSAAGTAQTIVVTVSNPTSSDNASSVFSPSEITAGLNDLVLFNFTQGNHTATQSDFFAPCVPVNYTNGTNGFDSNFAIVPTNFTGPAFPIEAVPILQSNVNKTMWFYDVNTCADGGVGVINLVAGDPATSGQTLDGFRRNAVRLNGTSTSSSSSGPSSTGSTSASASATSSQGNSASAQHLSIGSLLSAASIVLASVLSAGLLVVL